MKIFRRKGDTPPHQATPREFDMWTHDLGPPVDWKQEAEAKHGACNRLRVWHDGDDSWWSAWKLPLWQRVKLLFTNRLYTSTVGRGFSPMMLTANVQPPELDPANYKLIHERNGEWYFQKDPLAKPSVLYGEEVNVTRLKGPYGRPGEAFAAMLKHFNALDYEAAVKEFGSR